MSLKNLVCLMIVLVTVSLVNANIADFEDLTLSTAESHWNGSDGTGGFVSGNASFNNYWGWDNTYGEYWGNFAYSNCTDTTSTGMAGQYCAIAGGADSGDNYGIIYTAFPAITLASAMQIDSIAVTNNNYAYYSMRDGDGFAKKFGDTIVEGEDGPEVINQDAQDWFMLTITGKNTFGDIVGTVDFYLADYRFAENSQDYIISDWTEIDLTSLGTIKSLEFALSSSDNSTSGYMNTPAYFAIDTIVPEPATMIILGLGAMFIRRKKK